MTVYLDHNATTPLCAEARAAMERAMDVFGNPSSVHGAGRQAQAMVEDARKALGDLIGGCGGRITFTASGTEAINTALKAAPALGLKRIMVSAIEHDAVLAAAENAGLPVDVIAVDENGVADISFALPDEPTLICLMAVNNETGVIQPVEALAARLTGTPHKLFVDAVQAAGKLPLGPIILSAHMAALSAHKIGGPKGVGALWVDEALDVPALIHGGGQERRRRAGTENTIGIAGFGAAAASVDIEQADRLLPLRTQLEDGIAGIAPGAVIAGAGAPRVSNTVCAALPGVKAETQVMSLDLDGICVSAGSACSSGKVKASHVLRAMGWDDDLAASAIRISMGRETTPADIETFLKAYAKLVNRVKPASSSAA